MKELSIQFVNQFKHLLHPKDKMPNQSFMDIIEDIYEIEFKLMEKEKKTLGGGDHLEPLRPVLH